MEALLIVVGIDLFQGGLVKVTIAGNHDEWGKLIDDDGKVPEVTVMGGLMGELAIVAWYCDQSLFIAVDKAEIEDMVIDHINRVCMEIGEFHYFKPPQDMIDMLNE